MQIRLAMRQMQQMSASDSDGAPQLHQLRVVAANDADEHAHNLTGWEQRYDQISAGPFSGSLVERRLDDMQVFCEHTSQAVRQSCNVWPDAIWFGMPLRVESAIRINGRRSTEHSLLVRPGSREFELLTPPDYAIYGMVIPEPRLQSLAAQLGCRIDWQALHEAELLRAEVRDYSRCAMLLRQLLAIDPAPPALPARPVAQGAILSFLLNLLDNSEVDNRMSRSLSRRRQVVAAAHDYVLAHHEEAIGMPELCAQLGVSRRTLQYCFEDVTGISPLQYLRAMRLNGVRRQLQRAGDAPIADIASAWGFTHLSQFAADYRQLFGVCPSQSRSR